MGFNLKDYYARIGFEPTGEESPAELLDTIHYKHITHIPFEGIEAYMDRDISLKLDDVFEKLVIRRRGGYCFEHNCLLNAALKAAGIENYGVLTRISRDNQFGMCLHRMNIAQAGAERYIADVGFGADCFVRPLRFETDIEQTDGRNTFRLVKSSEVQYSIQILRNGQFEDLLGFDDKPAPDCDFELSNFYTNHSPESGFRMFLMCAKQLDTGKVTLFGRYGTIVENGKTEHFELKPEELKTYLNDKLGINMEGVELELRA